MRRAVLDAMPQHIHHAAFADLLRQSGEKLRLLRPVHIKAERLKRGGLRGFQKREELPAVKRELFVIVGRRARNVQARLVRGRVRPARSGRHWVGRDRVRAAGQRGNNEVFKSLFSGVRWHDYSSLRGIRRLCRIKISLVGTRLTVFRVSNNDLRCYLPATNMQLLPDGHKRNG